MRPTKVALALFLALVGAAALLALLPPAQRWSGDVRLFEEHVGLILAGRLAETPFLTWYPPLALVPLGIPLMAGPGPAYALAMATEMAALAAAGVPLLARLGPAGAPAWRGLVIYSGLIVASSALVLWRYDIVPAVMVLFALWAAHTGRWAVAGASLALAGGLKVYALILAPLLFVHAWRAGGLRAAIHVAVAGVVAALLSLGTYLLFAGSSPLDLLGFTANRPLHVETVAGTIVSALVSSGQVQSPVAFGSGSFNFTGQIGWDAVSVLRLLQPMVLLVSLAAGVVAIVHSSDRERTAVRTLALACLTAIVGLLITNPVLSPQYLLWVLPLLPLVNRNVQLPMAAAFGLTAVVFPWLYSGLITLDMPPLVILATRNALLVGAWFLAMQELVRVGRRRPLYAAEAAASASALATLRPRALATPTASNPAAKSSVGP